MKYLPLAAILAVSVLAAPTWAKDTTKPKVKAENMSRGTHQIAGGDGVFGTIYTLKNDFNFEILSAKYTIEAHGDYAGTMPANDEKLVWITFAVKNSTKDEQKDWGGLDVTLVDDNNQNYSSGDSENHTMLASQGDKSNYLHLLPGQGSGQDPVRDELSCAVVVPAKSKIVKIILNYGRKTVTDEKVVRYTIAGNPGGSPKNIIKPLPKYAADPTDPTGATVAIPATAITGKYYPDGYYAVRFDGFTTSTDAIYDGKAPDDGSIYVIAAFTAKNAFTKAMSSFDLIAGQTDEITLRDTDNEKYKVVGDPNYAFRKAKTDEAFKSEEFEVGEEFHYRYFFAIPKAAKAASITFGQGKYGHSYKVDLTTP